MHKGRNYPHHFYHKRVRSQWWPHLVANRVELNIKNVAHPGSLWRDFPLLFVRYSDVGEITSLGDSITYRFPRKAGVPASREALISAFSIDGTGGRQLFWVLELKSSQPFSEYHHTSTCRPPVIDPAFAGGDGHGVFGSCYDILLEVAIPCAQECWVRPQTWNDFNYLHPDEKFWHPLDL
jgi:hypothetical protein